MVELSKLLKKGNWELIPAQHFTEIVGLTKTSSILQILWCSTSSLVACDQRCDLPCRYIPTAFLVSLVIRDAKLAVCEADLNQKDNFFFLSSLWVITEPIFKIARFTNFKSVNACMEYCTKTDLGHRMAVRIGIFLKSWSLVVVLNLGVV